MSNRYAHHQRCVPAHVSFDVKLGGPECVLEQSPISRFFGCISYTRPLRFHLGIGGSHPSNRNHLPPTSLAGEYDGQRDDPSMCGCIRDLWSVERYVDGVSGAVVWRAVVGYT